MQHRNSLHLVLLGCCPDGEEGKRILRMPPPAPAGGEARSGSRGAPGSPGITLGSQTWHLGGRAGAVRRIIPCPAPSVRGGPDFCPLIDLRREINDVCLPLPPHAAAKLLGVSRCSSPALAGLRRLISHPGGRAALFISCADAALIPRSSAPSGEPRQAQGPGTERVSPWRHPTRCQEHSSRCPKGWGEVFGAGYPLPRGPEGLLRLQDQTRRDFQG